MNVRWFFLFLAAALFGPADRAQAQLAAYGTVTVEHLSSIKCVQTVCGSNDGTINPIGGFGGVYYDFRDLGPFRLGIDLRAGKSIGNKSATTYFNSPRPSLFSVLGGIRGSFKTPIHQLRPYIEGAVGLARTDIGVPLTPDGHVASHSGVQFRGFAGVDLSLLPQLDFRVVEFGGGGVQGLNSTYPIESISTGLVFHLPF